METTAASLFLASGKVYAECLEERCRKILAVKSFIPAQNVVSVSAALNHNRLPPVLDSDSGADRQLQPSR